MVQQSVRESRGKLQQLAATLGLLLATAVILTPLVRATTLSWYVPSGPQIRRDAIVDVIVPGFEAQHPEIDVEIIWAEQAPDKLKTLFAAGTPPDVVWSRFEHFPEFVHAGLFAPLDDLIERTDFDVAAIPDAALEMLSYNGVLYGLPHASLPFNVTSMYINLDLLSSAGLVTPQVSYDDPQSGWTYDDLRDMAMRLTVDRNGDGSPEQWGFSVQPYTNVVNSSRLLWNFGARILDMTATGWVSEINSAQARDALEFVHQLRFIDGVHGGNFTEGNQGMFLSAINTMGNLIGQEVPFDWTVVAVPRGSAGRWGQAHSNPMGVSSASAHKAEAFELIKYFLSDGVQFYLTDIGALPPQTVSAARREAYIFTDEPPYDKRPFFFGRSRSLHVWAPGWPEIEREYTQAIRDIVNSQDQVVSEVLTNLDARIETILRQHQ